MNDNGTNWGHLMPLANTTNFDLSWTRLRGRVLSAPRGMARVLMVLCPIVLAACDGAEEREAAYFERGKALFEEGDFTKARLELKNARQINPLNMEALYYLGLIAERERDYRGALGAFMKVSEQIENHVGANLHAGGILLAAGEVDDAFLRAGRALDVEPDNADGRALRSAVYLRRGRLADARADAEAALAKDPGNIGATSVIVGILRKEDKPDEAIAMLQKMIDDNVGGNAEGSSLRLLLIELYREQKNIDGIREVYDDLFELQPLDHGHRVNLAKFYIEFDRKDAAEEILREGVERNPDEDELKLILIDFLANQRTLAEAETVLKRHIAEDPDSIVLRFGLAQLYAAHADIAKAQSVLREIAATSESKPEVVEAKTGLAQLDLVTGEFEKSEALLAEVLGEDPSNGDALTMRSQIRLRRGELSEAIADLRRVLRDEPNSTEALALLADAHLLKDEVDLAAENLRLLLAADPRNDDARLRLASIYAGQRDFDKSLALVDEALDRNPDLEEALRLRGDILIAQGRLGPARVAAERYLEVSGGSPRAHISVAQVHQAEERHVEAIGEFEKSLAKEKDSVAALTGIVRSYLAMQRGKDAIDYLKTALGSSPDNAFTHNLLGEVYAFENAAGEAEESFRRAAALRQNWSVPYINLSRMMVADESPEKAVELLKQGLRHAPKDATLRFALANAQEAADDVDAAIEIYRAMLEVDPDMEPAANNLAALLADHKYQDAASLDEALKLARRFQTSENPFYLDTLGWIHYRNGDYSLAVVTLNRAVEQLPDHPFLNFHLGMAHYKSGQMEEAKTHLEKAMAGEARFPEIAQAREILNSL